MGRAEADPENRQPDEQTREHEVLTQEYTSTNLSATRRLIAQLPPGLKQEAKRLRRTIRKTRRAYQQLSSEVAANLFNPYSLALLGAGLVGVAVLVGRQRGWRRLPIYANAASASADPVSDNE
jgi:hypothetical protein